jgi:hypothetical protein
MNDYAHSTSICESIIMTGIILFLTSIMVCAIYLACTAYIKPQKKTELYVVQSAYCEVIP